MSGIAGVFWRDQRQARGTDIEPVARTLGDLGREYQDFEIIGSAALIYAHASATPESFGERQPVRGGDGRFVLVFDGRLDYREDLARRLEISSADLANKPDSWLAMRAWERWGDETPERLEGDFAFIVWDTANQRLFAARDPFGFRVLYYHADAGRVVVASTTRAIFAIGGVPRIVDLRKVAGSLVSLRQDASRSMYEGVSRVPAAHCLAATRSECDVRRYWSLGYGTRAVRLGSDNDYVEAARELFDNAVKTRLRTNGLVGADLTGGLDSSAVAVTALRFLGGQQRLPVFTHVPEPGWDGQVETGRYGDETPFVRDIVAMHPRLEPTFLDSSGRGWDHGLRDYFATGDISTSLPLWLSYWDDALSIARKRGVKTMLNGDGGNLTLSWSGVGAYPDWLRRGRLLTLFREIRAVAPDTIAFLRRLATLAIIPLGPDWLWKLYARLRFGAEGEHPWSNESLLNPDFASRLRRETGSARIGGRERPPRDLRRLAEEALTSTDTDMGEHQQAIQLRHGMDYRSPLCDRRLAEWCFSIPEEQYLRNGEYRWLARRVMAERLPESILRNPARGSPLVDWHARMTRDLPAIREQIEVLSSDPDVAAMIDFPRILKLLDDWPEKTPTDDRDPRTMLCGMALPQALAAGRFVRWTKGANL